MIWSYFWELFENSLELRGAPENCQNGKVRKCTKRGNLKNACPDARFLLMFALSDPPSAPFSGPSRSRMGPGRSSGMCISHVCAHARGPASERGLFAVRWEGRGSVSSSLSDSLSKENSIPTYQRYVGMLKGICDLYVQMTFLSSKWLFHVQRNIFMFNGKSSWTFSVLTHAGFLWALTFFVFKWWF